MTRKEAIAVLECLALEMNAILAGIPKSEATADQIKRCIDAYDMAISALRQEKTVTERHELTNAQKIRAMTDDELNELFHEIYNAGAEDAVSYVWGNRTNNFEWTMEWLQQTAGEEDHDERKEN